jgi:hypothetical protein
MSEQSSDSDKPYKTLNDLSKLLGHLQALMNGIAALKWHSVPNINYEISYAALHQKKPVAQSEFDDILKKPLKFLQKVIRKSYTFLLQIRIF